MDELTQRYETAREEQRNKALAERTRKADTPKPDIATQRKYSLDSSIHVHYPHIR